MKFSGTGPSINILVKTIAVGLTILLLLSYLSPFIKPSSFYIIPFFGLIYPITFGCAILLLIYLIFRKSIWALLILGTILIGGKLHFRTFGINFPISHLAEDETDSLLRLMSYNVRLFGLYDWKADEIKEKREAIFTFLEHVDADVICFQEFYHHENSEEFPTRDQLIPRLYIRDYHEKYSQRRREKKNFGLMTMSKYPIIKKGIVDLNASQDIYTNNFCTFVDLIKNNDTTRIYNVHLQSIRLSNSDLDFLPGDSSSTEKSSIRPLVSKFKKAYALRAEQAEIISEHASSSPFPVVICGDFNDTPMSYVYNCFNSMFIDAFRQCDWGTGSTYVGRIPAGRIDYLFSSPGVNALDFHIQNYPLSDHRAIWANFKR